MEGRELETIKGIVQAVVFQNQENGYTVLKLRTDEDIVTVVGCLPGTAPGEGLSLEGSWTSHQSYGQQFKAERFQRQAPEGVHAIYEYLASGTIRGIGAKTARLIVSEFGDRTLEILEDFPEELAKIKGITLSKAMDMSRQFRRQTGLRRLVDFFTEYGLRPFPAARVYRAYGDQAQDEIIRDPYILTEETFGLDFFEVDALALRLGVEGNSQSRISAAVLFEMRHNFGNGHVFLPRDKLTAATSQLINVSGEAVSECIEQLMEGGYICEEPVAGVDACYISEMYRAETQVAERLRDMASRIVKSGYNIQKLIDKIELKQGIAYAPEQRLAVEAAGEGFIMVLTGGPGTGKTTTVRGILELYDSMGLTTLLAAPTGRAAKRLQELTGREAQTVHRLLGAGAPDTVGGRGFEKCVSDQLNCQALILDETSMMDIELMEALLEAIPLTARLVLVGDADQLPSVGPGNVFGDIIRSGVVPVVSLVRVFRQAEESAIVSRAHMINDGRVPDLRNKGGDFFFLQRSDADRINETVTELISQRLPDNMGIPANEIQVLSPTRKGAAGIRELNEAIQKALNPPAQGKKERPVGEGVLRVGDRVMQTRNNYDILWYKYEEGLPEEEEDLQVRRTTPGAGVYNGDIGYIQDFDEAGEYAVIRFDDKIVPYPFEMLSDLELAYSITIHKAQGSEYRAVIVALPKSAPMLMTRSVLYTAVTRARELLIIVGDQAVFSQMVANDRRQRRYSGLRARLAGETG